MKRKHEPPGDWLPYADAIILVTGEGVIDPLTGSHDTLVEALEARDQIRDEAKRPISLGVLMP